MPSTVVPVLLERALLIDSCPGLFQAIRCRGYGRLIRLVALADDSGTPFWIAASVSGPQLRVGSPITSGRGMGSKFRDIAFGVIPERV